MGMILIMIVQMILAAESNAQVSNAKQYGRLNPRFNVARRACDYGSEKDLLSGAPIGMPYQLFRVIGSESTSFQVELSRKSRKHLLKRQ